MEKIKRFLVFTYDEYYPTGGWNDFRGSFETEQEIFNLCKRSTHGNIRFNGDKDIYGKEYLMIVDTHNPDDFTEYVWKDLKEKVC